MCRSGRISGCKNLMLFMPDVLEASDVVHTRFSLFPFRFVMQTDCDEQAAAAVARIREARAALEPLADQIRAQQWDKVSRSRHFRKHGVGSTHRSVQKKRGTEVAIYWRNQPALAPAATLRRIRGVVCAY